MFGSFLPNLWSSCNQSVRSKEPTLLCNQVLARPRANRRSQGGSLFPGCIRNPRDALKGYYALMGICYTPVVDEVGGVRAGISCPVCALGHARLRVIVGKRSQ